MKIKLKGKQSMDSAFSYRGFSIENWNKLNSGKTVTIDSIPLKCRELNKIEEVAIVSSKSSSSKSSSKKGVK